MKPPAKDENHLTRQSEAESRHTYKSLVNMMNDRKKSKVGESNLSFRKSPFYQK